MDALAKHGIPRDKIFSEKISTRVRVRVQCEAALKAAREIKAHAPHCRVIVTVYEMKRLGRDAAELTALADRLTAHGLLLEMLAGPLQGMYDPSGAGRLLFAFFAAMTETERENIRESTLEGLDAAARKGKHGGQPQVITDDILHTARPPRTGRVRRADPSRPVDRHGKRKGHNPSLARIYRRSPNTRRPRLTPRPSRRRTPTSPPSKPKAKATTLRSPATTPSRSSARRVRVCSALTTGTPSFCALDALYC